ncbi:hypothetical protein EDB19DRAFT_985975 [Suillus lakei]|nr:hypothetical protein EDB19DRAFT_985975 [Suillus lakei]
MSRVPHCKHKKDVHMINWDFIGCPQHSGYVSSHTLCWFVVPGAHSICSDNLNDRLIMTTRLYAMYRRSRKVLVFLVVTLLAVSIANGITVAIGMMHTLEEEFILFGTFWNALEHFRELQRQSAGGITGDLLPVLVKTHVVHFTCIIHHVCETYFP